MGRSVSTLSHNHTAVYYDVTYMGMTTYWGCSECGESYQEGDKPANGLCGCCEEPSPLTSNEVYDESHSDWDWFIEDLINQFTAKYPSLDKCDNWEDEDHIFLENELIEIAVSEYCGLASVSMRAKDSDEFWDCPGKANFAARMADYVGKWMDVNLGDLRSICRFNNGEQVLERITHENN